VCCLERADVKRIVLMALLTAAFLAADCDPARALKDKDARDQIEVLRTQINQVESSLQVRQMGLGEQIQSIREEIARLEATVEEDHRNTRLLGRQLEVAKLEMQEALVQLNSDYGRKFRVVDENINRLLQGIEGLQKNIRTLSDNIQTMSAFEKKQEERISRVQTQLQQQINVVVEEVGRENLRLQDEIAGMARDIAAFQNLINDVDGRVRSLRGRLQEVTLRQEATARTAAASAREGHVVQRGETLSKIAEIYGVTVEAIMSANQLANANLIREGQTLTIPAP
jgi:LysM repeat protein